MPNKNSAKKALRQTKKRTIANNTIKKAYKNAVKTVEKGLINKKDITEELRLVQKKLGKAVKRGLLKKNTASRKLSRLTKKVNSNKIV